MSEQEPKLGWNTLPLLLLLAGCTNEQQAFFYDTQADLYLCSAIVFGVTAVAIIVMAFRVQVAIVAIYAVFFGAIATYAGAESANYRLEARRYACAALSDAALSEVAECRTVLAEWDVAKKQELFIEKQKKHTRLENLIR